MNILDFDRCTGCGACKHSCPQDCISFKMDEEGFSHPVIDESKCIKCQKCINVCQSRYGIENAPLQNFISYAADDDLRKSCSSGGVFAIIANYFYDIDGVVYGASFENNWEVKHIRTTQREQLNLLKGTKYVESNLGDCYLQIKTDLNNGKYVLFSGTPCQVAGLKAFLGYDDKKLCCIDLICKGVPSAKVWKNYIDTKKNLSHINFRDKTRGWSNFSFKYVEGEREIIDNCGNAYTKAFDGALCFRKSCYHCDFKTNKNRSDITLGDCWGYEKLIEDPNFHKVELGLSVVLIRTPLGETIFEKIEKDLICVKSVSVEDIATSNPMLLRPVHQPKERKQFFSCIDKMGTTEAYYKCIPESNLHNQVRLLDGLLRCYSDVNRVEDYLISENLLNVAIYGWGVVGKNLYGLLSSSNKITVRCVIDKNDGQSEKVKFYCSQELHSEDLKNVDIIIVSAEYYFLEIYDYIKNVTNVPIVSLSELLDF